jgi:chromosome partitioning protein
MAMAKGWKILDTRPDGGRGKVLCLANQKGGVGKTTTAVNLATALALGGHRILLVDLDPQGNATTGLGKDRRSLEFSSYDLILGSAPFRDIAQPTRVVGLDLVPATVDLAGAEVELVDTDHRELRLARSLRPETGNYALTLIDCPPSLGLLTVNALACADELVVPVQCEYYALEGLGQLVATAERIRRTINPGLRLTGVLLTMYDARTKLAGQVADEVRAHFAEQTFATVVPRSVRLSEAPSFGEPVLTLDPSSRGSIAHRLLAAEVEERYGLRRGTPPPPVREAVVANRADPATMARGYGTVAHEPSGLDRAWPPRNPWTSHAPTGGTR